MIGHHLVVLKKLFSLDLEIFLLKENIEYREFHCQSDSEFLNCPVEKFCEHKNPPFNLERGRLCVFCCTKLLSLSNEGKILGRVLQRGETLGNPPLPRLVPLNTSCVSKDHMFYMASEPTSECTLSEYCSRWIGKIVGVYGPTVRVEGTHIIESRSMNDTASPA